MARFRYTCDDCGEVYYDSPQAVGDVGMHVCKSKPTPLWGDRTCDCWVKDEPPEGRFELRNGAHNPSCPVYRVSGDPVDAVKDEEIRLWHDPKDDQQDMVAVQVPTPQRGDRAECLGCNWVLEEPEHIQEAHETGRCPNCGRSWWQGERHDPYDHAHPGEELGDGHQHTEPEAVGYIQA